MDPIKDVPSYNLAENIYSKIEVEKKDMQQFPVLKNIDNIISDHPSSQEDKFKMFNEWCKREGVYMPKMEYPAFFEGGLIGARAKEDINHREAFLYVPYKILISVGKAQAHPVLAHIIAQNPECFDEEENDDYE